MAYLFQRLGFTALILLAIAVVLAIPVRDHVRAVWPQPVIERIETVSPVLIETRLLPLVADTPEPALRYRPHRVMVVETRSGNVHLGYLSGWREQPDEAMARRLPDVLSRPLVMDLSAELPQDSVLVLSNPQDETIELAVADAARLYRPNAMNLAERLALVRDRMMQRWTECAGSQCGAHSVGEPVQAPDVIDAADRHDQAINPQSDAGALGQAGLQR